MTDKDKIQFAAIMGGVAEVYGKEISKQALSLHFKVLEAYSIEEVQAAAIAILATRKFTSMPTPADFIEHISGGSAEDKAEVEAGKVLTAIEQHGVYTSVVFDDPTTQAVIVRAYGGWARLCQDCGVEESEYWFRKNFAKTWAAYSRHGVKYFGHLPGLFELTNCSNGFHEYVKPPALLGNPDKARAILEAGQQKGVAHSQQAALSSGEETLDRSKHREDCDAPMSIGEILNTLEMTQ